MAKRKNRTYSHPIKRRCVESDETTWFAFMTFILIATLSFWVYLMITIFKPV